MKCKAFERRQEKAEKGAQKLKADAMRQEAMANAMRNSLLNQLGGNAQQYAMNAGMSGNMANMANRYTPQAFGADDFKPQSRAWWEFWK